MKKGSYKRAIDLLLDAVFPRECSGCGVSGTFLCKRCENELPFTEFKDNVFAATTYQPESVRKTVWKLKYKKAKKAAVPLARMIVNRSGREMAKIFKKTGGNACLVAVPLSARRKRERGFNQSDKLAEILSDNLKIPLLSGVLYKKIHTPSQVEIYDKTKRLQNIAGSFSVNDPEKIKGRTIFLVDDVYTTGATMNEARKTLKKSGAKKVYGVVVARGR